MTIKILGLSAIGNFLVKDAESLRRRLFLERNDFSVFLQKTIYSSITLNKRFTAWFSGFKDLALKDLPGISISWNY
jgi:hypothetical protein